MAGLLDNVYARSPIWVQNAGVAVWGWWWFHRRFGGEFRRFVAEIASRDRWTLDQLRGYQERQLAQLLAAAEASPYYRRVFARAGIKRGDPPSEVLARLPLLTKQALREHGRELLTVAKPPRDTIVFRSSGTTGTPTEIFIPRRFHSLIQAFFEARNRNWAGVTYTDRRVMFGVRKVCRYDQSEPPFWRFSPAENLAYCSIYHLSPRYMPAYLDFLREFQPRVVMGYPNSLATLARFALENDARLPPARAIITTSETVTDEIRRVLEGAFGCPVRDNYCAVEACMLATQCEHGGYHVSPDFGVFEVLDSEGRPCPPGQIGRAVVTGLHNTLQPLIRYEIGDAVAWSEQIACACGRAMPLIRSIEGRIEDMCYTRDGRAVLRFDTVFKGIESIREAQVVQESLERFVIYVVPTTAYSAADRARLIENMKLHVGTVETEIQPVESIPRTPGGKFKPVVSKVSSPGRRPD
jgi:phenylacetate-CoA ligase